MAKSKDKEESIVDTSGEMGSIIELGMNIADAEQPDLLPAGEYLAEVRNATRRTSASSGNEYVAIQFYIPTEEFPADFDISNAPDGMTLTYNRVTIPTPEDRRAAFRLRKFMETIDAPFEGSTLDLAKWTGLKARVRIKHGTYEGQTREEISGVVKDV